MSKAPPLVAVAPTFKDLAAAKDLIRFAEHAEAMGVELMDLSLASADAGLDSLTLAAVLAGSTGRLRLVAGVDAETVEPYTAARGLCALDHLTSGRAVWRVWGSPPARTQEFVLVVEALWDSWKEGALVYDNREAVYSCADAVVPIHHCGAFFQVRGPLNMPRPPQGRLPRLARPEDGEGLALSADILVLRGGEAARAEAAAFLRPPELGGKRLLIEGSLEALGQASSSPRLDLADGLALLADAGTDLRHLQGLVSGGVQ